jgi:hypothetical protein
MFCPRCGQQASEEVSFCSRCGLPLGDAAALVESGGRAPSRDAAHENLRPLTPRERGTRKGLVIAAGGFLFFLLAVMLTLYKEDFFVLMPVGALVFAFGMVRALYGLLLEDDSARLKASKRRDARAGTLEGAPTKALHEARTRPAADFSKPRADTADMVAPHSVTEATTSLLKE